MACMEYQIISKHVVETRRAYMPARLGRVTRGTRKAGSSSLQKILRNEREAEKKLARTLNCNFCEGYILVTLKYAAKDLPENRSEAKKDLAKFLRKAKKLHEERTGEKLKYVAVTANWNGAKMRPARLHHHIVLPISSLDMLSELWPAGQIYFEVNHGAADLTALAVYLIRNTHGLDSTEKKWTVSQGLEKPIYTEPKLVEDVTAIEPLPNTYVVDGYQVRDAEGEICGSYIRAICNEPIRVRGGQVILPRRGKKKKMPLTIDAAMWENDE